MKQNFKIKIYPETKGIPKAPLRYLLCSELEAFLDIFAIKNKRVSSRVIMKSRC